MAAVAVLCGARVSCTGGGPAAETGQMRSRSVAVAAVNRTPPPPCSRMSSPKSFRRLYCMRVFSTFGVECTVTNGNPRRGQKAQYRF